MQCYPQHDIDKKDIGDIAVRQQQEIQCNKEQSYKKNGYHHPAYPHAGTQQFVVEMVLVG